ncbi:GCN5-related N-acetyltransferase [Catenulispora acidiphila DSM 44928]|uniref:GCN5-related N-acetyltransferase n=1 Tax=Catenulispora acidiphila (strain DSM 44928 / JCM 14897 / NBRC 102108 / NRRL B-24433 / ID139908) TaxID=479433 RepID=C7Q415_CATAD|nr:GNAT family N-acetyltransferase [Catenulispora acidiphila]ACU77773.1 GCN5-related N-acetyltransferase [Catenulispora acidiphila DSM 44928]
MTALQTPHADAPTAEPWAGRFVATRGTAADAALIEGWAGGAGWSLGRGDLDLFTRHRPGGLLIGVLDGRPVSAMATAGYDNGFCFTGALIVDPGFRGRGIGTATADIVLSHAEGRPVGLEAPPTLRDFFAARGFFARRRTIAFAGAVPAPRAINPHVTTLDSGLLGQAAALDARCFPAERTALAADWAIGPDRYALGFVQNNRLLGYGVIRAGFGAARIGPLYASEPRVAAALFDALAEHAGRHGARAIAIDIPEPNPAAMALCETRGLSHDSETLRMVRPGACGDETAVDVTLLYGLTSRELG